jgi:diguanylate cyclase (GGDEF)-like protein
VVRTVAGILTGSLLLAAALPWASAAQRSSASASLTQAEAQLHIDPEAGRREADAALEALQREPDIDLEIRARLVLCDYYAERDRDQAAAQIAVLNTLLPRAQQPGLAAGVLNCQGKALEISAAGAQARTLYDQAVSVAGGAHDDRMLAQALLARGDVRGSTGAYAAGLSDLRAAQALFEQQKTPQQALTALDSIAIIYDRMGDYSEAAQMFKRAIAAQHDAGLRREEAVTWYNLGRTYEYLHQWESARSAFKFALESSTQLGYVRMQAYASRGLASIANAQDNPDEALALLLRSRNWQQQTPDALLLAQIELTAGRVLHRLGRLQDSAASLEQALAVFQQADSPAELAETYGELAAVRAELGDWRAAYDARSLAQSTATRLLRNQLDQRFAMLKVEFDTDSQAKRNALLMQENEANEQALAQQLKANNLQTAVTVLSVLLLAVLATLAVHQRRNSRRLRTLAMTDELTGIANRRALLTRLSRLLRRSTTPSSILIIDIDHFKTINDRHGHLVGDETLKVMTAALRDGLDKPAFFGRLGGEEFAAILPDTAIAEACAIAERLRERVMRIDLSRWLGDRRMTVSIGIAVSVPIRDTTSSMLRRADAALYAAKDAGRNCVRCEAAAALPEITPRVA